MLRTSLKGLISLINYHKDKPKSKQRIDLVVILRIQMMNSILTDRVRSMLGLCMLVLLMVLKEWVMNAERQQLNVKLRLMIILVQRVVVQRVWPKNLIAR